jgi:hypothetical protein
MKREELMMKVVLAMAGNVGGGDRIPIFLIGALNNIVR